MDQLNRFFFVDEFIGVKSIRHTLPAIFDREAHTPKAKNGNFTTGFSQFSV
jgi:hypothetical protein